MSEPHHYVVPHVVEVAMKVEDDEAERAARREQVEAALRDRARRLANQPDPAGLGAR